MVLVTAGVRVLGRSLVVLVAVASGVVVGAVEAQAHSVLVSTDPADASVVAVAPARVTLTFREPARSLGTEIVVRAPDGRTVSAGDAVLVDSTVRQDLSGSLPAGAYTVEWRVTSGVGHPLAGSLTFTATGSTSVADVAGPGSTIAPVTQDAGTTGIALGSVAGLGGIVVVLVVIAIVLVRRRHAESPRA